MPNAEITSPPHQHNAETTPAFRGPECSSQPPQMAAEQPRKMKNRVKIQLSIEIGQSQSDANTWARKLMFGAQATGAVIPMALDSGNQNTEKPYAMPMHRWMANAAGGTSQRLKPGLAMMRSLDKNAGCATMPLSLTCVFIIISPSWM